MSKHYISFLGSMIASATVGGILVIGVLLIYLPAFIYDYNGIGIRGFTIESKSLEEGANSTSFWLALVVGASISIPIGFDIVLDWFYVIRDTNAPTKKQTAPQGPIVEKSRLEKFVVWRRVPMWIFSVPYLFMAVFHITPRYVMATLMAQRLVGLSFIFSMLQCDDLMIWTKRRVLWMIVLSISHEVLSFYSANVDPSIKSIFVPLYVTSWAITFYGMSFFLWYSFKWHKKCWRNNRTPEQQLCLVFMGLAVFHVISIIIIRGFDPYFSPVNRKGENYLITFVVVESIVVVVATIMPGRVVQFQLNSSNMELSVKGKFVRYMVHEIRNPTSIVMSGVEILLEKLETLKFNLENSSQSSDLYNSIIETLHQVQSANVVATEVLNDFLTFDKLKSRMLVIEPKLIDTFYFVDSSSRPFYLPALQRGIELECNTDLMTDVVNVLRSTKLYVDSSKIGQVMRNLLSNAMKFSKRGGRIVITTEIIPFPERTQPISADETPIKLDELVDFDGLQYICLSFVRLSVIDSWAGISKEDQSKLFQEYMQVGGVGCTEA